MKQETFTDFDAFRASNAQVEGQWLINGGTDWLWRTESLAVGSCQMVRCYSHTGLITEGVESHGCYQFYVPFGSGAWRNNGVGFNEDEVLIVEPGAEHCQTTNTAEGFHGFCVPKALSALDPETRGEQARYSYTVKNQRRLSNRFRQMYAGLLAAIAENPGIESSPAARLVEAELRSMLEPLLRLHLSAEESGPSRGRPRVSRREIVERSRVMLEKFDGEPIHVSELAKNAGVSLPTLEKAFNDYFHIGPRQYLRIRQLHKVRRELLVSDPDETTVSDVLTRWGVWEFGRFSGRYKLQFGELPSETLRRRSQTRLTSVT